MEGGIEGFGGKGTRSLGFILLSGRGRSRGGWMSSWGGGWGVGYAVWGGGSGWVVKDGGG